VKSKSLLFRGRLGPKSLCGTKFHVGHRDIAEKTLHHFKKAAFPLKMDLKSLTTLKKNLNFSKKVFKNN
jgi:hypothetical protein